MIRTLIFILVFSIATVFLVSCDRSDSNEQRIAEHGDGDGHDHASEAETKATGSDRVAIPAAVRSNLGISFVKVERRRVEQTLRVPGRFEYLPTRDASTGPPSPVVLSCSSSSLTGSKRANRSTGSIRRRGGRCSSNWPTPSHRSSGWVHVLRPLSRCSHSTSSTRTASTRVSQSGTSGSNSCSRSVRRAAVASMSSPKPGQHSRALLRPCQRDGEEGGTRSEPAADRC